MNTTRYEYAAFNDMRSLARFLNEKSINTNCIVHIGYQMHTREWVLLYYIVN